MKAEIGMTCLQAKERWSCQQTTRSQERATEQQLPHQCSHGTSPANTLILDFQSPELYDKKFLSLKPQFVPETLAN